MDIIDYLVSFGNVLRYHDQDSNIQYIPKEDLLSMLEDITRGHLSHEVHLNTSSSTRIYEDDKMVIVRQADGLNAGLYLSLPSYYVYYNSKKVYPNPLIINADWILYLFEVYQKHLDDLEQRKKQLLINNQNIITKEKILKVFKYALANNYHDDRINIFDVTESHYQDNDGNSIGHKYDGKISLSDNTIVFDTYNGIYVNGDWVDYVCHLVDQFELQEQPNKLTLEKKSDV